LTTSFIYYQKCDTDSLTYSRPIDSRVLAVAFHKAIEVLGERSVNLLIDDLKHYGVYFDEPNFDLQRLSGAIGDLVGESAASLIFERFIIELDKISERAFVRRLDQS
jgi:hypothetical protein